MDLPKHTDGQSATRAFVRNRWVLATLAIIVGSCGGMFLASAAKAIQPQLLLPDEPVDVGRVLAGSTAKGQARIKNGGLRRLNLSVTATSCQCTSTQLRQSVLGAKQSTTLDVAIAIDQVPGPFEISVHLASNDPRLPEALVRFVGEVLQPIEFDPPSLRFDGIEVSDLPVSQEVQLSPGGVDLFALGTPTVHGSLRFVTSEIDWLDDTLRMTVSLARDAPSGLFRENLALRFDNFDYAFPVMGKILGPVEAVPDVLLFNSTDAEAPPVSSVRIRAREGLVIEKLDVITKGLPMPDAFVFAAIADAKGWLLRATLDPATNSANKISGTIEVRVVLQNHEQPLYLRVPILVALGRR